MNEQQLERINRVLSKAFEEIANIISTPGYYCGRCGSTFAEKIWFENHIKNEHNFWRHGPGGFYCNRCDAHYTTIEDIGRHCKNVHGSKYEWYY